MGRMSWAAITRKDGPAYPSANWIASPFGDIANSATLPATVTFLNGLTRRSRLRVLRVVIVALAPLFMLDSKRYSFGVLFFSAARLIRRSRPVCASAGLPRGSGCMLREWFASSSCYRCGATTITICWGVAEPLCLSFAATHIFGESPRPRRRGAESS